MERDERAGNLGLHRGAQSYVQAAQGILTAPFPISYSLRHAEKIPVPDVAVAILNGTCNLLLNCSVAEGAESATFVWTYTRRRVIQIKEGPTLRILSRPRAKDMVHTCLARNPVSQSSKTISIEDYCESGSPASIFQALKATCIFMFFGLLFSMTNILK
nr:SLAM family member 7-like [Chrysemys picta bellii]